MAPSSPPPSPSPLENVEPVAAGLSPAVVGLIRNLSAMVRPPRLRTMLEFAEQEIVLPTGQYEGLRFNAGRNPYAKLFLAAIDSGLWRRFLATGPSQSGKTLVGFSIPIVYHLFEMGETGVLGAPTATMAMEKWYRDLLPLIRKTKYAHLLPQSGAGSKGGEFEMIEFGNGAVLRVMTAHGDDKARASFTARWAAITEAEKFGDVGSSSVEANKLEQIIARTNHYHERARVYQECTVGADDGVTWTGYTNGTATRIAMKCPHCQAYVTPEREHLVGWQDAETEIQARDAARLCCPACAAVWNELDRAAAMRAAVVVHKGQKVNADGAVEGKLPETFTLGFRWTAAHNLLVPMGEVGLEEWKAERATDEEDGLRKMCQFFWAMPPTSEQERNAKLKDSDIIRRTTSHAKGEYPVGTVAVTCGIDVGKWLCHWVELAWVRDSNGALSPHVVEYGRFDVPTSDLGEKIAIRTALLNFVEQVIAPKWAALAAAVIRVGIADAGYEQEVVLEAVATIAATVNTAAGDWLAAKGRGVRQYGVGAGGDKREAGSRVVDSGDGWEAVQFPSAPVPLLEHATDKWKGYVQASLTVPRETETASGAGANYRPGAMTLHKAESPGEHMTLARHAVAEEMREDFVAGKGLVRRLVAKSRSTHYLDAWAMAVLAAAVARLIGIAEAAPVVAPPVVKPKDTGDRSSWMGERPSNWTK